jgi:hypothetical protein
MAERRRQRLMAGDPIALIGALASVILEVCRSAQAWMREAVSGMNERVSRAGLLYERAVGLAYIAAAQQRSDDAQALLDEASAIAEASQAHRILQQVNQARAELSDQHSDRPA